MIIDGVDAKQIVQRSILSGVVSRPVDLQKSLPPDEKRELCSIIQAARQRMAHRQKREAEHKAKIVRCITAPGQITVDGMAPKDVAAAGIKAGLACPRLRRKVLTIEEVQRRAEKQRMYVRESTRRWRAKKKAAAAVQACSSPANPPPTVPPVRHECQS